VNYAALGAINISQATGPKYTVKSINAAGYLRNVL
jgi:hypothetical protein